MRKAARYFLRLILCMTLFFIVLGAAGYVLLHFGPVNEAILSYAKKQIERNTGWQFDAQRMDRLSPFSLRLRDVVIIRPGLATITADRIALTFSPHNLLTGQVVFPSITLRDVTVVDNNEAVSAQEEASGPFSLHLLPLGIQVHELKVSNLKFNDLSVDAIGELQLSALKRTAFVDLTLYDNDNAQSDGTYIVLSAYQENDTFYVDSRVSEDTNGILHHLLGILKDYSVEFTSSSSTQLDQNCALSDLIQGCQSRGQISLLCVDSPADHSSPSGILGDTFRIAGRYHWNPSQALTLNDVLFESKHGQSMLQVAGDLKLSPKLDLDNARFYLNIEELQTLTNFCPHPLGGSLEGTGTAKGSWTDPKIDIDLKTAGLTIDGKPFGDVRLQGEGSCFGENIQGALALCCDIGPVVTTSTFDFYWDYGPILSISDFHWQSPTAALRGQLNIFLETFQAQGHLEGETGDLAWLIPKSFGEVHGTGWVSLDLYSRPGAGEQAVDITTEMQRLDYANLYSERMELTAQLSDIFGNTQGKVKITARESRIGSARLKNISLTTDIYPNQQPWTYRLLASGRWDSKFLLKASGTSTLHTTTPLLVVDELAGRLQEHSIQLTKPMSLSIDGKEMSIDSLSMRLGQGLLSASGNVGEEVELSIQANRLPFEILHLLTTQVPAEGTISGSINLHGKIDNPEGSFQIDADKVLVSKEGLLNIPPFHARAKGWLRDKNLTLDGSIEGIGNQPVSITAALPVQLKLSPLEFTPIHDTPLSATLTASGEVAPLLHLLVSDVNVTGQADFALDFSGTYKAPLVHGTLDLKDCSFEDLNTGSIFKNIDAHFVGRGTEIELIRMSAQDGQYGAASASGTIFLDSEQKFPFDIEFYVNNALLLRRDYISGTATGSLYLTGNYEDVELNGDLSANTLTVTLPKEMPTPAACLDITFVNTPAKQAVLLPDNRVSNPMRFNIAIDVPGRAYVRSDDLRSEWMGAVTVKGTSNAPLFNGQLHVSRGDYRLNGRTFVLDKGDITFAGELDKKTSIYVVARQDIDEYTIEAVLKGPIRDPSLTLRSNPHMSQREILSWIIFNRGLNDITPFENDVAGQAVVDLSRNSNNTPDMMARLKSFGIDRFDVTSRNDPDNRDLTVNIGKYLSSDCFISLNRGLTSESNSVSLEANLIKYVKFQAEVDDEATGGVRLMWKHDY